jgi:hypothetical protein
MNRERKVMRVTRVETMQATMRNRIQKVMRMTRTTITNLVMKAKMTNQKMRTKKTSMLNRQSMNLTVQNRYSGSFSLTFRCCIPLFWISIIEYFNKSSNGGADEPDITLEECNTDSECDQDVVNGRRVYCGERDTKCKECNEILPEGYARTCAVCSLPLHKDCLSHITIGQYSKRPGRVGIKLVRKNRHR